MCFVFEQVQGVKTGLGWRGPASAQRHSSRTFVTQRLAYDPDCDGSKSSPAAANAGTVSLMALMAITGGLALGLAECQVSAGRGVVSQ